MLRRIQLGCRRRCVIAALLFFQKADSELTVSTALWTGVYLSDVLAYVKPIRGQAKHVIFEGGDSLPNGPYGTSQRLSWAASKERGMLLGAVVLLGQET